ncbi:MAG: hypothetical protein K0U08_06705 [Proteobacteria bacterium]|nr:hypothetical protein [Pseudomonadota bacterium]MCH9749310.1 hypothetical protein [Pseudomonadota bacterium]
MLITNVLIALVVFATSFLMAWLSGVDIALGNYLWLPMGAKVLAFLLFGFWAFPGVLLGSLMSGFLLYDFWNVNPIYGPLGSLVGALAPMLAILIMQFFRLSNFFNDGMKVQFGHVLFLVILSSLINTLFKLFIYLNKVTDLNGQAIDPVQFIQNYLAGDILGGFVFIYIVFKFFTPQLVKHKLI